MIQVSINEPDLEFVSRRRRRDRPAAEGADAEHFGERRDQDARRGAGGTGTGWRGQRGAAGGLGEVQSPSR